MKNYFFDSESIGFYSPTVLIQYAIGNDEPKIHNIFEEPVKETLNLIEDMCANNVIGFNLAHDWFHMSRTYGVLQELPKSKPPKILDIYDVENEPVCHDKYCLKPHGSLDLMLYGRANELQATMNQKDIIIRRVPRVLAPALVAELEAQVKIPKLYFAKREGKQLWKIKQLHRDTVKEVTPTEMSDLVKYDVVIDSDFVNLRLSFHPSTGLKPIMKYLLNKDIDLIEDMLQFKKPVEYSWFPCSGQWLDVAAEHIYGWSNDKRRIRYAIDDVHHTRDLYKHYGSPEKSIGEYNSMLACMVGAIHWKGYSIDEVEAKKQLKEQSKAVRDGAAEVNVNSPKQVMKYLKDVANPFEEIMLKDTTVETLFNIQTDGSPELVRRATLVLEGRHASDRVNLLERVIRAGRLYVTFKITGTKSDRASGGSMEEGSKAAKGGSINPQGIGGGDIRKVFDLARPPLVLDGGDFDGNQVAIFAAVSNDPNLNKLLLTGQSMHAIWGSFLYNKTYDYIKSTSNITANEPDGYYKRSKASLFAKFFDAQVFKLSQVLQLSEEEVQKGIDYFETEFPGIAEEREKVYQDFGAMSQPDGIGTAIKWREPKKYVESFLGFKRYFTLEFSIIKALFELAQNPTKEMKQMGHLIKVKRRDRLQTGSGALQSAVYSAAFSLQSSLIRAAMNHKIQSPEGTMTKVLQNRVWSLQPKGVSDWVVMPFNVHDELETPVHPSKQEELKQIVLDFIEEYKKYVPLLSMTWKQNLKSWGEK